MAIARYRILVVFAFSSLGALGNGSPGPTDTRFQYFVQQYLMTSGNSASWEGLAEFAEKMDTKRLSLNNDYSFLRTLYARVHSKFLKQYASYTSFADLLSEGRYDCLTGVAIYALLLDRYKYDYQIIETNYHIFLMVSTRRGPVLLEATDPLDGFVIGKEAIEQHISMYRTREQDPQGKSNGTPYTFTFDLFRTVTLPEITGLLYFNLAVDAFNRGQIETSQALIQAASTYYQSERIEEFSRIIRKVSRASISSAAERFFDTGG